MLSIQDSIRRVIYQPPYPPQPLTAPDGFRLLTSQGPAAVPILLADPEDADGPRVIFLHGNADQIATTQPVIEPLRAAGFGVAAIEYPGYGPGSTGVAPHKDEVLTACVDALDTLASWTAGGLTVLLGHSLGSAIATHLAALGHGDRLVVAAGFTSVADVANHYSKVIPALVTRRVLGAEELDNATVARAVRLPTLIAHGTADRVLPFSGGRRLAREFSHGHFVEVPGADHLLEDCWVPLAQLAIADPSHWPDHLDQPARDRHGPTA